MNLYKFAKTYLAKQTLSEFPDYSIVNLRYYEKANLYSYKSLKTKVGEESKEDVYKLLVFILQNRFNLPNVINFMKNFKIINSITHNFNVDYVRAQDPQKLTKEFYGILKFKKGYLSWLRYCRGLVDAAKYMNEYFTNFKDYLSGIRKDPEGSIKALCKISGMGEVLARNFLKELGLYEFGKPDVHLIAIFKTFDSSVVDPKSFDVALRAQSEKCGCTPYALDRVLWLICSGKYFLDDLRIGKKNLRDKFIKELNESIKEGKVII